MNKMKYNEKLAKLKDLHPSKYKNSKAQKANFIKRSNKTV